MKPRRRHPHSTGMLWAYCSLVKLASAWEQAEARKLVAEGPSNAGGRGTLFRGGVCSACEARGKEDALAGFTTGRGTVVLIT